MNPWFELLIASGVLLGALLALGVPVVFGLGLRGFPAVIVGVPAALSVVAVASVLSPILGVGWSLLPCVGLSLVVAAVCFLLRRYTFHRQALPKASGMGVPLLGALTSFAIIGFFLVRGLPAGDAISQTYDATFHLNAVRFIIDTGSASPLDMNLTTPGSSSFYPTLWHALVALVVQLTGLGIPVATNATLLLTVAIIWPIGAIALGRAVAGPSARATMISSVLAAAFPNFPLALGAYGVLYPNLLSLALMPYVFVALLKLFSVSRALRADPLPPLARWLLFLGALGAAAFAHPNAVHITLLVTTPFALFAAIRAVRMRPKSSWVAVPAVVAFAATSLAIWYATQVDLNPWGGELGPRAALLDGLGTMPRFDGHNLALSALLLIGVFVAWRVLQLRPLLGFLIIGLGFHTVADGFPNEIGLRDFLLSPWYSDPWRIAAMLVLALFPLTVLGTSFLASMILPSVRRGFRLISGLTVKKRPAAGVGLLILLLAAVISPMTAPLMGIFDKYYSFDDESRLLTPDERLLLERLGDETEAGASIITNPWNGSSLAYAISGRQVLQPHLSGNYSLEASTAPDGIATGDEAACAAASVEDARYVLDFGDRYVFPDANVPEALTEVSNVQVAPALTERDREGEAVLYEITGCASF